MSDQIAFASVDLDDAGRVMLLKAVGWITYRCYSPRAKTGGESWPEFDFEPDGYCALRGTDGAAISAPSVAGLLERVAGGVALRIELEPVEPLL